MRYGERWDSDTHPFISSETPLKLESEELVPFTEQPEQETEISTMSKFT